MANAIGYKDKSSYCLLEKGAVKCTADQAKATKGQLDRAKWDLRKAEINVRSLGHKVEEAKTKAISPDDITDIEQLIKDNAKLEIVATIAEHYVQEMPVIVDNAESVTRLIDTDGQVIRLEVSEADKALRVEVAARWNAAADTTTCIHGQGPPL